jgi:hypothetical protein
VRSWLFARCIAGNLLAMGSCSILRLTHCLCNYLRDVCKRPDLTVGSYRDFLWRERCAEDLQRHVVRARHRKYCLGTHQRRTSKPETWPESRGRNSLRAGEIRSGCPFCRRMYERQCHAGRCGVYCHCNRGANTTKTGGKSSGNRHSRNILLLDMRQLLWASALTRYSYLQQLVQK